MASIFPFPRSPRRHCIWVPGTVLVCLALFGATQARSQDVAEAARQERAKKDSQQKKSKHVYTNEDLKHPEILTPEDREQVQAKKNQDGSPAEKPANPPTESIDALTAPAEVPLGDVARENRKQKLLRELQQPQQSAQFRLPVANAPLAAPKPPVFPGMKAPSSSLVITLPPARPSTDFQPFVRPKRRSPFERTFSLASPAIRPSLKVPSAPAANSGLRPVAPPKPSVVPAPAPKRTVASPVVSVAPKTSAVEVMKVVEVRAGDSLWKIAEQKLGRGSRWHDLVAVNPKISDPSRIGVGTKVVLPSIRPTASLKEVTASRIKVQKGDTLWMLAQAHFGHASSWNCIAQANPSLQNPDRIFVGQELLLPASCTAFSR